MKNKTFLIDSIGERGYAADCIKKLLLFREGIDKETGEVKRIDLAWDVRIELRDNGKSREQEMRYHAMIGDVARQCRHLNQEFDAETWKRLLVDQFKRDTLREPECCAKYWARHQLSVIPSLDGSAVVVLGEQTRQFPMKVATVFIEWLLAWGGNSDPQVAWTDPTQPPIEAYQG